MKRTKVKALLLSISLAAAMSAPSAAGLVANAASDAPVQGVSGEQDDVKDLKGTITVTGIKAADKDQVTVTAYQVVDGVYKDNKLVKYVLMDPTNARIAAIGDESKGQTSGQNDIITEKELTHIADEIQKDDFTADTGIQLKSTDENATFTASVEPGMYVILVSGATDTVYNPAVVAVNLSDANADSASDIVAGSVNLSKFFTTSDGTTTTKVYVKSTDAGSQVDKKISKSVKAAVEAQDDSIGVKDPKKDHGDTIAFGDVQKFEIDDLRVPSYSEDYESPSYTVTDTLEANAFGGIKGLKVHDTVSDADLTENSDYTIKEADGITAFNPGTSTNFQIQLTSDYLNKHRADATADGTAANPPVLQITYNATLLSSAGVNYAENVNHAVVKYSNDPSEADHYKEIKKNTYTYTFGIGAAIDGEDSTAEINNTPGVFNKVSQATGKTEIYTGTKAPHALRGAEFTLYSDEDCKKAVQRNGVDFTSTSDDDGHVNFSGLDEGTYYVKETKAPEKYTLSPNVYKFKISADLDEKGVMKEYTINISYKDTSIKKDSWEPASTTTFKNTNYVVGDDDGSVTNNITTDESVTPVEVVDTKLRTLPSTGGTGIVLIIGVAAALGVAGVVLSKKGKQQ